MSIIDDEEEMKDFGLIEIDGVNVAECELLQRFYNSSDEVELYWCNKNVECKDICDCDFKQLQRLKKENENLKKFKDAYYSVALKYKTALEEIRDALNQPLVLSCNATMDFAIKKVIKHINEVLNDVE